MFSFLRIRAWCAASNRSRSMIPQLSLLLLCVYAVGCDSKQNRDNYYKWMSGGAGSPVRSLTLYRGKRVARCTSAQLVNAMSTPPAKHTPYRMGIFRFDSAVIELADGRTIYCNGGGVDPEAISFELDDFPTGIYWTGVDPAKVKALVSFIRGPEDVSEEREF